MDINWLLQQLKSGTSYTINDGTATPYQVTKPASALSRRAAQVIAQLHQHIQELGDTNLNLQAQINTLIKENDKLRAQAVNTPSTKPESG